MICAARRRESFLELMLTCFLLLLSKPFFEYDNSLGKDKNMSAFKQWIASLDYEGKAATGKQASDWCKTIFKGYIEEDSIWHGVLTALGLENPPLQSPHTHNVSSFTAAATRWLLQHDPQLLAFMCLNPPAQVVNQIANPAGAWRKKAPISSLAGPDDVMLKVGLNFDPDFKVPSRDSKPKDPSSERSSRSKDGITHDAHESKLYNHSPSPASNPKRDPKKPSSSSPPPSAAAATAARHHEREVRNAIRIQQEEEARQRDATDAAIAATLQFETTPPPSFDSSAFFPSDQLPGKSSSKESSSKAPKRSGSELADGQPKPKRTHRSPSNSPSKQQLSATLLEQQRQIATQNQIMLSMQQTMETISQQLSASKSSAKPSAQGGPANDQSQPSAQGGPASGQFQPFAQSGLGNTIAGLLAAGSNGGTSAQSQQMTQLSSGSLNGSGVMPVASVYMSTLLQQQSINNAFRGLDQLQGQIQGQQAALLGFNFGFGGFGGYASR